jgi:uncharacterized membrane protein
MTGPRGIHNQEWLAYGTLLLGFLLLAWELPAKGLWADELYSIELARQTRIVGAIYGTAADVHPPLYYLVLWVWMRLAGFNDASARFPSIVCAMLAIALGYPLGRRLLGRPAALLSALLLSTSPFLVLYSRMARYYAMALLLGTLASWLCVRMLGGAHSRWLPVGYALTAAALVYTDYPSAIVLVCHALFALLAWRRNRPAVWRIWGGLGAALLLYLLWIPVLIYQTAYISAWTPAGFSVGLFGLLFKIGLPVYSFCLGETTLPWHPVGFLGAALVGLLWLIGARRLLRTRRWQSCFVLTAFALPFIFIILFSIVIIYAFPSRVLVAAPFFFLTVAVGIRQIPSLCWRNLALAGLSLAYAFTLGNYYLGRQFINPTYALSTRQIIADLEAAQHEDDVIVSERDSGLDFYLEQKGSETTHFVDYAAAKTHIAAAKSQRVWVLSMGRDSTRSEETPALIRWLEERGFQLQWEQGYAEVDPRYRRLKTRVLGYPAYQYRAILRLYERP